MKQERKVSYYKNYFIDFFMSLDTKAQKKLAYVIDMLKTGERISVKFVKHIRDGVYEMRATNESNRTKERILCRKTIIYTVLMP